jgi:hypothetical protein
VIIPILVIKIPLFLINFPGKVSAQAHPAGARPASQGCAVGTAGTMMFSGEVSCPAATQAWKDGLSL